jgi:uncharacterized membrane protein YgcG
MRPAVVLVAALALGGCTKPRTEAVIVVDTAGVRIPIDVEKIHFKVADRAVGGDDTVFDADVVMCHDQLSTGCYNVPLSAALFPGKMRPSDSVRVEVDALGAGGKLVIADAALFTFAEGQSLRLDFVLYANCLGNVDCAVRDQACGPDDMCMTINPTPLHGEPDLGLHAPVDMAGCGHLNQACCVGARRIHPNVLPDSGTVGDMAIGPDMTVVPPDMSDLPDLSTGPDLAMGGGGAGGGGGGGAGGGGGGGAGGGGGGGGGGSSGGTCDPNLRCVANVCVP